jgi:DnaJ-domain-containing protein 1
MKTIEELKQEIIELKQQFKSTTIAEDRRKLMKQILDMTFIELADLELADLQRPYFKLK